MLTWYNADILFNVIGYFIVVRPGEFVWLNNSKSNKYL